MSFDRSSFRLLVVLMVVCAVSDVGIESLDSSALSARMGGTSEESSALESLGLDVPVGTDEYKIKAQYLRHFVFYTTWPGVKAKDTIVIAVVGPDPFKKDHKDFMTGTKVKKHPVKLRFASNEQQLKGAHIVFLTGKATAAQKKWARAAAGKGVMLVTEEKTLSDGAVMNFVFRKTRKGGRAVRIQCDNKLARKKGLKISTKLLKAAVK